MQESGMNRVRRALGAMKQAEMARLAAVRRAAAAERAAAEALRRSSASQEPGTIASDMLTISNWQAHAEAQARAALARAAEIDRAAAPLEAALSRTIGRENVIEDLLSAQKLQERRLADRRSEGS